MRFSSTMMKTIVKEALKSDVANIDRYGYKHIWLIDSYQH